MKKKLLTLFMLAALATTALGGCGTKEEKTVIENIMESQLPIPIMTSQSFDARC